MICIDIVFKFIVRGILLLINVLKIRYDCYCDMVEVLLVF